MKVAPDRVTMSSSGASGASSGAGVEPSERLVIGVLALQGSYPLHSRAVERCGAIARRVRKPADLEELRGLILPGGESTAFAILAHKYGLFEPLRELGRGGLPMLGTCAGAILLGRGDEFPARLGLLAVDVERNAYGRQLDSFSADIDLEPFDSPFHAVFIRAPKFRVLDDSEVETLGVCGDDPVLLRGGNILLTSFHPELTDDLRLHQMFLESCRSARPRKSVAQTRTR